MPFLCCQPFGLASASHVQKTEQSSCGRNDYVRADAARRRTYTGRGEIHGQALAVAIGARVASRAGPGQVLVSQTVKDLTVGSGLGYTAAGEHELKGVPGEWRLYRLMADG